MQCPSCHNEVAPQATFCGFCGSPLTQAAAGNPVPGGYAPVGGGYAQVPPAAVPVTATAGGLSENAAAAIAYITIIPAIVFLVLEPYNRMRLVKFHSIQNLALAVTYFVVWMAIMILHLVLHFIPFISVLFLLVDLVVFVGFFIGWLIALIKASQGVYFKLPIIGDFAEKQANS